MMIYWQTQKIWNLLMLKLWLNSQLPFIKFLKLESHGRRIISVVFIANPINIARVAVVGVGGAEIKSPVVPR